MYVGRDLDSTANQAYDLARFLKHFDPGADGQLDGARLEVDEFNGREQDLSEWIQGLMKTNGAPLSGGRRNQIRDVVLKLLEGAGVFIVREKVARAGKRALRAGRGAIRWLERAQAAAVAAALPDPWSDYFQVQVAMGFRPDELITLKRGDFHGDDFATVSLSPLNHLTLKLGTRTLKVPSHLRALLERRFDKNELLFPCPETGETWPSARWYNRCYHRALKAAGVAAGVKFALDCRTARRTAASLWLREGMSVERVAVRLGDNAATVREHYAAILPQEVEVSGVALAVEVNAPRISFSTAL